MIKILFISMLFFSNLIFAQKFPAGISGLRFYNYPNANVKTHLPQSVIQSENNDKFCKILPSKKLKLKILDEAKNTADAYLIFSCGEQFGYLSTELSIDFKSKIVFKGQVFVTKENNEKYILSSDKFRIQFFYYTEKKSENCALITYDILNNNFYETNSCEFLAVK